MHEIGVSAYTDFNSTQSIEEYLTKAKALGFTKVFTSLILGNHGFVEAAEPDFVKLKALFAVCRKLELDITADMNGRVLEEWDCSLSDLSPLVKVGISRLRIDDGMAVEQLCELSKNEYDIKIELSAAYPGKIDCDNYNEAKKLLHALKQQGNLKNITACHNFYPLPGTGMDVTDLRDINQLFRQYDVPIGGFVASQSSPRDLHKRGFGIATIEKHRYMPPYISMQELFREGFDFVYIGDSKADIGELELMARYLRNAVIQIPIVFNHYISDALKQKIMSMELKTRIDQPGGVLRISDTRGIEAAPGYCTWRSRFSVSILNSNAAHYMGELHISMQDMEPSSEHNSIGFVHPEAVGLLESIKSGGNSFRFVQY